MSDCFDGFSVNLFKESAEWLAYFVELQGV